MKYYHFARLQMIAILLCLLGMFMFTVHTGLMVSFIDFRSSAWFFLVPVALITVGFILSFSLSLWLRYKIGSDHVSPHSPEGMPVSPTGIWVDAETLLEPGSFVLALLQGQWHRAVVVEMKSGDRFLVHFLGWDSFWDQIQRRGKLQVMADDLPTEPTPAPPKDETSIREG
jgi:hypothetical protein